MDMADEMNPALGLRAIRFSLQGSRYFKRQLKAILRASTEGKLKILFPMIPTSMKSSEPKLSYRRSRRPETGKNPL